LTNFIGGTYCFLCSKNEFIADSGTQLRVTEAACDAFLSKCAKAIHHTIVANGIIDVTATLRSLEPDAGTAPADRPYNGPATAAITAFNDYVSAATPDSAQKTAACQAINIDETFWHTVGSGSSLVTDYAALNASPATGIGLAIVNGKNLRRRILERNNRRRLEERVLASGVFDGTYTVQTDKAAKDFSIEVKDGKLVGFKDESSTNNTTSAGKLGVLMMALLFGFVWF
jgi:hypothetical protein